MFFFWLVRSFIHICVCFWNLIRFLSFSSSPFLSLTANTFSVELHYYLKSADDLPRISHMPLCIWFYSLLFYVSLVTTTYTIYFFFLKFYSYTRFSFFSLFHFLILDCLLFSLITFWIRWFSRNDWISIRIIEITVNDDDDDNSNKVQWPLDFEEFIRIDLFSLNITTIQKDSSKTKLNYY